MQTNKQKLVQTSLHDEAISRFVKAGLFYFGGVAVLERLGEVLTSVIFLFFIPPQWFSRTRRRTTTHRLKTICNPFLSLPLANTLKVINFGCLLPISNTVLLYL